MLYEIAGGEKKYRERPFVSNSNCFVVPPMKFATESCEVMEACIRGGMPVLLLSAGMAGATAPSTVRCNYCRRVAECLAGLVYVNAIEPGHPTIFGTWPFVSRFTDRSDVWRIWRAGSAHRRLRANAQIL